MLCTSFQLVKKMWNCEVLFPSVSMAWRSQQVNQFGSFMPCVILVANDCGDPGAKEREKNAQLIVQKQSKIHGECFRFLEFVLCFHDQYNVWAIILSSFTHGETAFINVAKLSETSYWKKKIEIKEWPGVVNVEMSHTLCWKVCFRN